MCCGIIAVIETGGRSVKQRLADQVGEIERMSRVRDRRRNYHAFSRYPGLWEGIVTANELCN
jgi:hypothetical protein